VERLEDGDERIFLSWAFVCYGPITEFLKAREFLRALPNVKLIYNIASTKKLFVVKEREEGVGDGKKAGGKAEGGSGKARGGS
jgi:hypothetical protein